MNVEVYYCTRSGNTEKLAAAISAEVGAIANEVGVPLEKKADVLFLGSSLYAGKPDPAVREFVENNADRIGVLAVFGSSASGSSTYKSLKALAEEKGIAVFEKFYNCPGHFWFMHKNRPNEHDLDGAASFARYVLDSITD